MCYRRRRGFKIMNYLRGMKCLAHRDDSDVSRKLVTALDSPTIANAVGIDWDRLCGQRMIVNRQITHSEWIVPNASGQHH